MKTAKRKFIIFIMTFAFVFSTGSAAAFASGTSLVSDNLFMNPGFENGFNSWQAGQNVTLGTTAHTGTAAAKIANTILFTGTFTQENMVLETGTYEFSFYYYYYDTQDITPEIGYLFMEHTDNGESVVHTGEELNLLDGAAQWYQVTREIEITENGTFSFSFGLKTSNCTVNFDDFSLKLIKPLGSNGGFEEGLNYWEKTGTDATMVSDTNLAARTGVSSLMLVGNVAVSNGVQQQGRVKEAGLYELKAYVKAAYPFIGNGVTLQMLYEDTSGQTVESHVYSGTDIVSDWTEITCQLYIPIDAANVIIVVNAANTGGVFVIDDITLNKILDDNQLQNSGFEDNLNSWTARGVPNVSVTTSEKYSGAKAVKMVYSTSEDLNKYLEQSYHYPVAGTLNFSAQIKTSGQIAGVGAVLFIDALDANGNVLATENSASLTNSNGAWQRLSVNLTLPQGTQKVVVKIGGIYCTGTFYVDAANLSYVV